MQLIFEQKGKRQGEDEKENGKKKDEVRGMGEDGRPNPNIIGSRG